MELCEDDKAELFSDDVRRTVWIQDQLQHRVVEAIRDGCNRRETMGGAVFLDLTRAFDTP